MKQLVACALLLVALGCATSDTQRASTGRAAVARSEGSAESLAKGQAGSWQPIRVGQALNAGDQIRTGPEGQVDISFSPYGGVITLMPNSAIELEQLGAAVKATGSSDAPGTNQTAVASIRLTRGRVVGDTLKLPKGSKVVVKTNAGTFAIP